jgi:hypothetical protein
LLIGALFGFLNIKSVKIYAIPFIFSTTLLLHKLDLYIIIETKEFARIGYNGFLFPHSYSGDGLGATHLGLHLSTHAEKETRYAPRPSPEYSCGKRNLLYPIRAASFVSIVLYLILVIQLFNSSYLLINKLNDLSSPRLASGFAECDLPKNWTIMMCVDFRLWQNTDLVDLNLEVAFATSVNLCQR